MKSNKFKKVVSLRTPVEVFEARYLKNLTSALSHYLESPYGNELVVMLGSGLERTNREALATWVSYHRQEVFEVRLEGRSPLDYLINKLEQIVQR